MSNLLTTLADAGKQAATYVINNAAAQPRYTPMATTPYVGSPPIIASTDEADSVWYSGLLKIKDDLITQLQGAARDTVKAVAGGTVQALQDTPQYRAERAKAGMAMLGVGVVAIIALAVALRK